LATKLPQQSNNAAASGDKSDIVCFRCKGPHHVKNCPKKGKSKDKSKEKESDNPPAAKRIITTLPAWRYLEPRDLTKPLVDDDGQSWKFCTKCVCKKSGKPGIYLLSHFDSKHQDDWTPPPPNESNMAAVDVPLGVPAVTTVAPSGSPSALDDDPIEFQGAWCACVVLIEVERVFCETVDDDVSTFELDDTVEVIPLFTASVESEMDESGSNVSDTESKATVATREPTFADFIPTEKEPTFADFFHAEREVINHVPARAPPPFPCITTKYPLTGVPGLVPPGHVPPDRVTAAPAQSWFSRIATWMFATAGPVRQATPRKPSASLSESLSSVISTTVQIFQPQVSQWFHQMTLLAFWVTMMVWETITYVVHSAGHSIPGLSRREGRRRDKLEWLRRHSRDRLLPILIMVPTIWMVMTNVITTSGCNIRSPISLPVTSSELYLYGSQAYHRVSCMDELVMLDCGTLLQFNKI
jgi:hypothetical protein